MPVYFAGIALAIAWLWFFYDSQRQDKLIRIAACLIAAYVGFLVWVVFGSLWKARARWTVFIFTIVAIVFCRFGLRISGVTGDLIPIVQWRWKERAFSPVHTTGSAPAVTNVHGSYPQFLGPSRDGTLSGPALARDWKATPPRELWRRPLGAAWSGFAVEGRRAVTQEQQGENEIVACYDLLTGQPIWSHTDKSRYATTIAGEGPRATPTIFNSRVYTMGGAGELNCLDLESGKVLWHTNTLAANDAKLPEWGVACSPLVNERGVFVTAGGRNSSMIAFNKDTGAVLWKSGNDNVHWSSPIRASFDDVPQILIFSENVSSYDKRAANSFGIIPGAVPIRT